MLTKWGDTSSPVMGEEGREMRAVRHTALSSQSGRASQLCVLLRTGATAMRAKDALYHAASGAFAFRTSHMNDV